MLEIYKYDEALDLLLKAKFIYEQISRVKDELEQAIYKERCGQIDTFIRQCTSSLGRISAEIPKYEGQGAALIADQVHQSAVEASKAQQEAHEVTISGRQIPLKTEKLQ